MNTNLVAEIRLNLANRETAELTSIWVNNNRLHYSDEFFAAVQAILQERLPAPLPEQNPFHDPAGESKSISSQELLLLAASMGFGLGVYIVLGILFSSPTGSRTTDSVPPWLGVLIMTGCGTLFYYLVQKYRHRHDPPAKGSGPVVPIMASGCGCKMPSACGPGQGGCGPLASEALVWPELVMMARTTLESEHPGESEEELFFFCRNGGSEAFFVRLEGLLSPPSAVEGMVEAGEYLPLGHMNTKALPANLELILEVERLLNGEVWHWYYTRFDRRQEDVILPQQGHATLLSPRLRKKITD